MNLNHLNLAVSNVVQTQQLFEKYFGLTAFTSTSALAVLADEKGFTLTLSNFKKELAVTYPADFHIGFVQETQAQVDALYQRLTSDGFVIDAPRKFHGSWTFYWREPGGLLIEVLCFTSAG
ncbi:VOC family protein [Hymenobacter sp. HMF4947]|uniref:VOC family protein n=1 Tax=Hymenobacter ginkgonis TaxID=2682976 RepID=A0A7K1TLR2_9BACT|nr:VOC family protein [Hymenobacter ginkgonis]MVN79313.1 VOC family protein [Hymenobacter ginkgonis]